MVRWEGTAESLGKRWDAVTHRPAGDGAETITDPFGGSARRRGRGDRELFAGPKPAGGSVCVDETLHFVRDREPAGGFDLAPLDGLIGNGEGFSEGRAQYRVILEVAQCFFERAR